MSDVPDWRQPADREPDVPVLEVRKGEPEVDQPELCLVCKTPIRTMAFKGTGACSDEHVKELYGSAALPKFHGV